METKSDDCPITNYRVDKFRDTPHTSFDNEYHESFNLVPAVLDDASGEVIEPGRVQFEVAAGLEDDLAVYQYYVRVTVDDDFSWSNEVEYTFIVECGLGSTDIEPPPIDEVLTFSVDYRQPLRQPYFVFGYFDTQSPCQIEKYELYETIDAETLHPDFVQRYEDREEEEEIAFRLVDTVEQVIGTH